MRARMPSRRTGVLGEGNNCVSLPEACQLERATLSGDEGHPNTGQSPKHYWEHLHGYR